MLYGLELKDLFRDWGLELRELFRGWGLGFRDKGARAIPAPGSDPKPDAVNPGFRLPESAL